MKKTKVSMMWFAGQEDSTIFRGVHPVFGQVAGYFEEAESGAFIAHRTSPSGSFFERDVWAEDGFKIEAVIDETAEWYCGGY